MANDLARDLSEMISGSRESLLDFVPRLTPRWRRPDHLAPVASLFERAAAGEEVRACVSVPPQHGKTELLLHGLVWLLRRHSDWTAAYSSYNSIQARSKSRIARGYAANARLTMARDADSLHEWRLPSSGGLLARGIGEGLTGQGVNLAIVDDPHKDRAEAESSASRNAVGDWFSSTLMTRVHPGGSVIVVHTRWHPDDLIGRLTRQRDRGDVPWEIVNLPAISASGEALAEWLRPLTFLLRRKAEIGEYDWTSLYEGQPRPRGGRVFSDVRFYDRPPTQGFRLAIGVDLAYSAKTSADYSVAILLACAGDPRADGVVYVLDVRRLQVQAPEFVLALGGLRASAPWAPMRWYCSGPEKGSADLVNALNPRIRLEAIPTSADKFVRAQPVAAAWNAGRVLVPREAPWLDAFVSEIVAFTGLNDPVDDQVDGLAAGFDALGTEQKAQFAASGGRTWSSSRSVDL